MKVIVSKWVFSFDCVKSYLKEWSDIEIWGHHMRRHLHIEMSLELLIVVDIPFAHLESIAMRSENHECKMASAAEIRCSGSTVNIRTTSRLIRDFI